MQLERLDCLLGIVLMVQSPPPISFHSGPRTGTVDIPISKDLTVTIVSQDSIAPVSSDPNLGLGPDLEGFASVCWPTVSRGFGQYVQVDSNISW